MARTKNNVLNSFFCICMCFALLLTAGSSVFAAGRKEFPKRIKAFGAWAVYGYNVGGKRVCYALSAPISKSPSKVDHGKVYFLISRRPSKRSTARDLLEPQFLAGYTLKHDSSVLASVISHHKEGKSFNLFTNGKCGWLRLIDQEVAIIHDMSKGAVLKVKAVSARGTKTTYNFSLSGLGNALKYVRECK